MNNKKRSTFSGGFGFVLAAAGSAVGLGNIWRFPYLAAKYGGGIFLLFYILLVVTFGFSLMIAENAIISEKPVKADFVHSANLVKNGDLSELSQRLFP